MPQALDHLEFDAIIGWAFGVRPGPPKDVFARAIVWPWDVDETQPAITAIPDAIDVIAVIPNIERAVRVTAEYVDGTRIVLGYLFHGASHPQDWEAEAAARAPE